MPVAVEAPQKFVIPPHKRWTRDECTILERSGLINIDRYELIEGELIQKMPKGQAHILAVALLASWLRHVFGEMRVVTEPTIDLRPEDNPTSIPEPDVIVLTRSIREFSALASPHELQLVAEVSSSSLAFDMTTKAGLYARSEIQEYWVLDVEAQRLLVYLEPTESGYGSIQAYGSEEFVSPLAAASAEVRVIHLLQ